MKRDRLAGGRRCGSSGHVAVICLVLALSFAGLATGLTSETAGGVGVAEATSDRATPGVGNTTAGAPTVTSGRVSTGNVSQEGAFFETEIVEASTSVETGEPIVVIAEITNNGSSADDQLINFTLQTDGETVYFEQRELGLDAGESQQYVYSYVPEADDTGELTAVVASEDTSSSTTIQVLEPLTLQASFTPAQPAPDEQLTLEIDANRGDLPVLVGIFDGEGTEQYQTERVLDGNGEASITVVPEADLAGPGDYTALVADKNGTAEATANVTVGEAPEFGVEITQADQSVTAGEQIDVTAAVTNLGESTDARQITFEVTSAAGEPLFSDQQEVSLDGGETDTVSFDYETQVGDTPAVEVTVSTDSDQATREVEVLPAETDFSIELLDVPEQVTEGDVVPVTASVTNDGSVERTDTITFQVTNETGAQVFSDEQELTLGPSETEQVSFSYETAEGDAPGVTVAVTGGNDSASAPVSVEQAQPAAAIEITDVPQQVTEGDQLPVTASVTNVGGVEATQQVTFEVSSGGETVFTDERELTLGPEESETVNFSYQTEAADAPSVTVTAATANQTDSASVAVAAGLGTLHVSPGTLVFPTLSVGASTSQSILLENVGNGTLELPTVQIEGAGASGFTSATSGVTLEPGETKSVGITFTPSDPGEYVAQVEILDENGDRRGSVDLSGAADGVYDGGDDGQDEDDKQDDDEEDEQDEDEDDEQDGDEEDDQDDDEDDDEQDGDQEDEQDGDEDDDEQDGDQEDDQDDDEQDGDTTVDEQPTSVDQEQVEITVDIANATAGEPVDITVPVADGEQQYAVENISLVTAVDTDATVNITSSSGTLDTTPTAAFPDNGTTQLGNISVTSTLDPDEIEEVAFTFWVNASELEQYDSGPEDIALYRFDEQQGVWVEKETDVLEQDGDRVRLRGVGEQFSEWTAALKRPEFNITETDVEVGAATTEEEIVIQVFVTNTGGADGTYEAQLLTNEEVVETKDATVPEGGTVLVTFLRTFSQPGTYEVQVNDVPVGQVEISEADEEVEVTTPTGDDGTDATETATPTATDEGGTDGVFGPGFGLVSALAGLSLAGYLLGRRRTA